MSFRPRIVLFVASVLPFVLAAIGQTVTPKTETWTLIVSGATKGYLAPCGCTKPMSGGIRRRATLIQHLRQPGDLIVEVGPIVGEPGRQAEMKAEALAQSMKVMGTSVLTLTNKDTVLGEGVLGSVQRLSGAELLRGDEDSFFTGERWAIGSDSGTGPVTGTIARARAMVAELAGEPAVFVTAYGRDIAEQIASAVPELDVVVYASQSNPTQQAKRVGKTWLVSPADEGKFVVTLKFSGERFEAPTVYELGPEIHDHEVVSRHYGQYQERMRLEKLVERMPKYSDEKFAGTRECKSCHEREYAVWSSSEHSKAWQTLKDDNHDADPDCVGCHTVGITSTRGFLVEEKTPELTNVGCESCHGAGAEHIKAPERVKIPAKGKDSCATCHNPEHSPNFDFEKYWGPIEH